MYSYDSVEGKLFCKLLGHEAISVYNAMQYFSDNGKFVVNAASFFDALSIENDALVKRLVVSNLINSLNDSPNESLGFRLLSPALPSIRDLVSIVARLIPLFSKEEFLR